MKAALLGLLLIASNVQASFIICENDSFKVDLKSDGGSFVEDDGMQGASFEGELVLTDKRFGSSFTYTSVFQTYNEFNDYGAYAMAFSKELGVYKAVSFEFASEGETSTSVDIKIPQNGFENYNGFSDFDEKLYSTRQEMTCEIKY